MRPHIPDRLEATLSPFVELGVLDASHVAVVEALTNDGETDEPDIAVVQAIVMACITRGMGHSCLVLAEASDRLEAAAAMADRNTDRTEPTGRRPRIVFPGTVDWIDRLTASGLVEVADGPGLRFDRPLVVDRQAGLLWLARYAFYEDELARRLTARTTTPSTGDSTDRLDGTPGDSNGTSGSTGQALTDEQQRAVVGALDRAVTFLVGGPGTGKTHTVGRIVDTAMRSGTTSDEIALAAPTGKAAERMTHSVDAATGGTLGLQATTIHRLLGLYPGATPRPGERTVPHRLVIIDEASMIDLPMMARLVGAVDPHAHLVFVGDPDQLASVDVGSVLADVVTAARDETTVLHASLAELTEVHRQAEHSPIIALATAIRGHDRPDAESSAREQVDRLLGLNDSGPAPRGAPTAGATVPHRRRSSGQSALRFIDRTGSLDGAIDSDLFDAVAEAARRMIAAAGTPGRVAEAFAAANGTKVLAATRRGTGGVADWSRQLRRTLGFREHEWKAGRPVIVTRNDPANGLSNGDTGITVVDPEGSGTLRVAFPDGDGGHRFLATSALADFEDWWAMTIHKSQGSEYGHVIVSLPDANSPLLTRELLYTAVTRGTHRVTIVGTPDVLYRAIATPTVRASGLVGRLTGKQHGR